MLKSLLSITLTAILMMGAIARAEDAVTRKPNPPSQQLPAAEPEKASPVEPKNAADAFKSAPLSMPAAPKQAVDPQSNTEPDAIEENP